MAVDVNRILHTVSIDTKNSFGRQGLIVDLSGSIFVEQILFNKLLMFSSLYHHHKERASECMLKSIFEIVKDKKLKIKGCSLDKVVDFLYLTDNDFLNPVTDSEELKTISKNLSERNLLKRALALSWYTIKPSDGTDKDKKQSSQKLAYNRLLNLGKNPGFVRDIRELIAEKVGLSVYDVWIDLPEPPNFREAKQVLVKITDDQRERLDEILKVSHWLETYAENKSKGHVFCPPDNEIRKKVNEAACEVLKEQLNIEFNDFARKYSKFEA